MLDVREDPKHIEIPALSLTQPVGDFYIATIPAVDLYEIAKFDIRRITQREGIDEFMGIQRMVSPKRLKELKTYIQSVDATFPTAVIIAVDERCVTFMPNDIEPKIGTLRISNYNDLTDSSEDILFRDIAKIIDGQHRVKAFEDGHIGEFEINLAIFVGADVATQAEIFSTVNLAQTKVNRSLVYDLFSLATTRSPEKTAHEITVLLDQKRDSPFFKRIKRLGVATEGRLGEALSQATIVRGILSHITKSAFLDREVGKRQTTWNFKAGDETKFIFRYHFVHDKDEEIYLNMSNYFSAVRDRWQTAWNSTGRGAILSRTNGYLGLMRFLKEAYLEYSEKPTIVPEEYYKQLLEKIDLSDDDFTSERYPPGTSGETKLYRELLERSKLTRHSVML